MTDTTKKRPVYIKTMLMGLIIECPLGGHPKDCPLYDRRNLPMNRKVKWVNSLSNDELQKAYLMHCECLKKKEKKHIVMWN